MENMFSCQTDETTLNKDILETMCYDMFDEGKNIECGKEMNELEITGQNEEHEMKLILIT